MICHGRVEQWLRSIMHREEGSTLTWYIHLLIYLDKSNYVKTVCEGLHKGFSMNCTQTWVQARLCSIVLFRHVILTLALFARSCLNMCMVITLMAEKCLPWKCDAWILFAVPASRQTPETETAKWDIRPLLQGCKFSSWNRNEDKDVIGMFSEMLHNSFTMRGKMIPPGQEKKGEFTVWLNHLEITYQPFSQADGSPFKQKVSVTRGTFDPNTGFSCALDRERLQETNMDADFRCEPSVPIQIKKSDEFQEVSENVPLTPHDMSVLYHTLSQRTQSPPRFNLIPTNRCMSSLRVLFVNKWMQWLTLWLPNGQRCQRWSDSTPGNEQLIITS